MTNHIHEYLKRKRACVGALDWIAEINPPTLQAAWCVCVRPDWMGWLVKECGTDAARAAYGEAADAARAAYDEATAPAEAACANAIRAAVPVCPVAEPGGAS